jgi:hypothetical protein
VCFVDLAWVHDRNYEAPPGPGLGHRPTATYLIKLTASRPVEPAGSRGDCVALPLPLVLWLTFLWHVIMALAPFGV